MRKMPFVAAALALTMCVTPVCAGNQFSGSRLNQGMEIMSVKDTEKETKKAEKDAKKAEKKANKDAEKAEKKANKDAEKAEKKAEKEAEKAEKKAEKQDDGQSQDGKEAIEWYEKIKSICAERLDPEYTFSAVLRCDEWNDMLFYGAGYDTFFNHDCFDITIGDYSDKRISITIDPYTGENGLIIDFMYADGTRFAVDNEDFPLGEMEEYILNCENITWPSSLDVSALGKHDVAGDARLLTARLLYMSELAFDGTDFKLSDSGLVFDEDYSDVDLYGNYSGQLSDYANPWCENLKNAIANLDCSWEQDGEYCYTYFNENTMGDFDAVYYSASDYNAGIQYEHLSDKEEKFFHIEVVGDVCNVWYSIYGYYMDGEDGTEEFGYYGLDVRLENTAQFGETFSSIENLMNASTFTLSENDTPYEESDSYEGRFSKADVCEMLLSEMDFYMDTFNEGLSVCNTSLGEKGLIY